MSKLTIVLVVATVASAGAASYLAGELDEEREERAALQRRIAQLEPARPAISAPPQTSLTPAVPTTVANAPAPTPPASPSKSPPPPPAMFAATGPGIAFASPRPGVPDPEMRKRMLEAHEQQVRMLKNPEYRELMRTQQKHGMAQMYADLEPLLGLSEEESEQLLDVLAEQSLRSMEEQRPMFGPEDGSAPSEADIRERQRLYEEQRRKNDAEVAAVLGSKFNEWQAYQKNGWSRMQVTRLRQTLSTTDEPLRQDQIKPLVEAIAREQQQVVNSGRWAPVNTRPDPQSQARMAEEWLERTAQSNERIRNAVQGLLSPSQFEQLKRQQERELKMQELNVKQQRARAEAQARGEIPPDPASGVTSSAIMYSTAP